MKKLSTIIGLSLILCGIGYVIFGRKKKDEEICVEKPSNDEDIIKTTIRKLISAKDFNNPGDLVGKIIRGVMEGRDDFSILDKVPKNIEELEVYLKEVGFYEEYEKTLLELYTTNKKKD